MRGGIFDSIEMMKEGKGVSFREKKKKSIGDIMEDGEKRLREIEMLRVKEGFELDVKRKWDMKIMVKRGLGEREKENVRYDVG